jgi:hypothetical protein
LSDLIIVSCDRTQNSISVLPAVLVVSTTIMMKVKAITAFRKKAKLKGSRYRPKAQRGAEV